ncbi:uncharacterized protein LOC115621543 [Scaptodrosophila lebanonensis]|uniref:Uncharacterized protein LOC115621543 n=1 Tax=Drosophila lebanonensis TaxID=7225 RepID=A0A6J2T7G6_DROLE|nr:uncharacterized protein LOC115621543 [Scaptodrosophila lebanonensis]
MSREESDKSAKVRRPPKLPVITHAFLNDLKYEKNEEFSLPIVKTIGKVAASSEKLQDGLNTDSPMDGSELKMPKKEEVHTVQAKETIHYLWNQPCLMIVFDEGDTNSARHHLVESLHNPFAANSVATVVIQEGLAEPFMERTVHRMRRLNPAIAQHPAYMGTLTRLKYLKGKIYTGDPKLVPSSATPMVVSDFTHGHIANGPTGVITMHTFRTIREAFQMHRKEIKTPFKSVSIWNKRVSSVYDIVGMTPYGIILINCYNVDLGPVMPLVQAQRNAARVVNGYHYETFSIKKKRKIVVFPVGTIIN